MSYETLAATSNAFYQSFANQQPFQFPFNFHNYNYHYNQQCKKNISIESVDYINLATEWLSNQTSQRPWKPFEATSQVNYSYVPSQKLFQQICKILLA